ncbi:MAG TPA: polysaccharide deacetylase family protein [Noviherbaspirillum sp.]|nr:polysaccharide deacetylase family protein [Noviherbaspirillum sp.]
MTGPIPILVYHRIDDKRLSTSTSPNVFRKHMMWLSRHGWRSLSSDEFAFYATRNNTFPCKSFLLTFDDGYRSLATAALPILQELHFHATCFVATRQIMEEANAGEAHDSEERAFLTWDEVKGLHGSGLIDFQSHSHSHRRLREQSEAELTLDLRISQEVLSNRLALPRSCFRHLAWPWGDASDSSRAIAERMGFQFQYTVARLAFQHSSSLQHIPRTCYDGATFADFQIQFWLQSGPLSRPWHAMYPLVRKLRRPGTVPEAQHAPARDITPVRKQG